MPHSSGFTGRIFDDRVVVAVAWETPDVSASFLELMDKQQHHLSWRTLSAETSRCEWQPERSGFSSATGSKIAT
jgi:hypothetical protein